MFRNESKRNLYNMNLFSTNFISYVYAIYSFGEPSYWDIHRQTVMVLWRHGSAIIGFRYCFFAF